MPTSLPGVKVGPLDPDATAEFGRVDRTLNARQLVRRHRRQTPDQLRAALLKGLNAPRSAALRRHFDDLLDVVYDFTDEQGDRIVPKDATVVGANVRGEDDGDQVITLVYKLPPPPDGSGRTGKTYVPYDEDVLPESIIAEGDRRAELATLREDGLGGNAEVVSLLSQIVAAGGGVSAGDGEAADAGDPRVEKLTDQIVDLEARVQAAENPEPYEGFDEAKVEDVEDYVSEIKDPVEREIAKRRIREAEERAEKPRQGVLKATEPTELAPVTDSAD